MVSRRAESFSDGVFAVAITVLVFNLLPIADITKPPLTHRARRRTPQRQRGGQGRRSDLRPGHDRDLHRLRVDWSYLAAHQEQLGARRRIRAPRLSTVRFTAGNAGYAGGTLVAAFAPVAALSIFALLAVYYLFEHLPNPGRGRRRRELGAGNGSAAASRRS